jgi:hypothetical protein
MKLPFGVHTIASMYDNSCWSSTEEECIYARAVALPYDGNRLVAAWWVLTGKAYALKWPEVGDIERALELPFWNRRASKAS